jgi:hypothetical protein
MDNHKLGQTRGLPFSVEQIRHDRVQSAQEVVRYYGIYRQLYGLTQLPMQMLRPISSTLEVLFDDIGNSTSRDASITLSQLIYAFAKRFRYVSTTIRRLEEKVHGFREKVPLEVINIFEMIRKDIEPSPRGW